VDGAPVSGGLALHIAEQRDAKATRVVLWLIAANSTARRCRSCDTHVTLDADRQWVDDAGAVDCGTFLARGGLRVPHRPDTWTLARVQAVGRLPEERKRLSRLAGLARPCSVETWERVVVLFDARQRAKGAP
jgi:hypothetical protein